MLISARYIQNIIQPVLPYLQQEGDVLFQQDNVHPQVAHGTQDALQDVQEHPYPWPAWYPDISPIEHHVRGLNPSVRPPATLAELRQQVHEAWNNIS